MGLWRGAALFISPSVCMLMRLHVFVCARASTCARTRQFVLQWAPACSLCRVCLLPAKPPAQAPLAHLGSPGSCYSAYPLPLKDGGRTGGSGNSGRRSGSAGHKEKKKIPLFTSVLVENPRDTSVVSFCYFKTHQTGFFESHRGEEFELPADIIM